MISLWICRQASAVTSSVTRVNVKTVMVGL